MTDLLPNDDPIEDEMANYHRWKDLQTIATDESWPAPVVNRINQRVTRAANRLLLAVRNAANANP